jgi:hypothetical protein
MIHEVVSEKPQSTVLMSQFEVSVPVLIQKTGKLCNALVARVRYSKMQ